MKDILEFVENLNNKVVWGLPMVVLMLGTGVFLIVITKGAIFRHFGIVMRYTLKTLFKRKDKSKINKGEISPFQAVCTALAATVGTGNIVGVALAIATGGPGAIFWLWVSALIGMVLKYSEVTLSVEYRTTNNNGETVGGPMYYISKGMGRYKLSVLFAIFGFLASFGIGASVQANSLATSLNSSTNIPTWSIGLTVTILAAMVLIGGIKRISKVAEVLVPFMAGFYIVGAVVVLFINRNLIPQAVFSIFKSAFCGSAAQGGFLGASVMYACRVGIARGVFTHEAGMGSAPIAHASASTDHPARQGLWGAFEVFFDSIVMCTVTGLVILTSGVWCDASLNEATISSQAFENSFKGGKHIVIVGLVLFAFATIIAWYYYGEKCVEYIFKDKIIAKNIYKIAYICFVYIGCVANLSIVWEFADLFNGLMAIPNLIALLALSQKIKSLTKDFFRNPHLIRQK